MKFAGGSALRFDAWAAALREAESDLGIESRVRGNNVLAATTLYVLLHADESLPVELCTASDDSLVVFVNNQIVTAAHRARGFPIECAERSPALLRPGINKISTLVLQGLGGWAQRMRLILPSGHAYSEVVDGTDRIEIVSPRDPRYAASETPEHFAVLPRTVRPTPAAECVTERATTRVAGNSVNEPGMLIWTDEIRAADFESFDIEAPDATRRDVRIAQGLNEHGFLRAFVHLGPFEGAPGHCTPSNSDCGLDSDWLTDGTITESLFEPADGDVVHTDFAVALSTGIGEGGGRNPGGTPTATFAVDPDDSIHFADYYGGNADNVVMYSYFYFRLTRNLEDVRVAIASDDSIVVGLGPLGGETETVFLLNVARGFGGSNRVQNRSDPFSLPAGEYKGFAKVFEGGGGHGFRLRFESDGQPVSDPSIIEIGRGPGDYLVEPETVAIELEFIGDAAFFNDGVEYSLNWIAEEPVVVRTVGRIQGDAMGVVAPSETVWLGESTGSARIELTDSTVLVGQEWVARSVTEGIDGEVQGRWRLDGEDIGSGPIASGICGEPGSHSIEWIGTDVTCGREFSAMASFDCVAGDGLRVVGDFNGDRVRDISDPIGLLWHLFLGNQLSPCGGSITSDANVALLDSNLDGGVDLSDAVFDLTHLFLGGDRPQAGRRCRAVTSCIPTGCP